MEFPNTGERCSVTDCKQLDFLPIICSLCRITFCKEHFNLGLHKCPKLSDNIVTNPQRNRGFICVAESCNAMSPIEILCTVCKKHFCLEHRFHGCLDLSEQEKLGKLKKWQLPKKQFAEAKAIADKEVINNLKKSKNSAMASKVQYMRIKGTAIGLKKIPASERCYFLVYLPITVPVKYDKPLGIFVSKSWTIGKAIDSMSEILKLQNTNNQATAPNRLNLFQHINGVRISHEMDKDLKLLFDSAVLTDGQSVILEYSNEESVDQSLYK